MRNFWRAVKLVLQQRLSVAGLVVCCLAVALLWGANLGSAGPIIEVVFRGKSLRHWVDEELAKARRTSDELRATIANLEKKRQSSRANEKIQEQIAYEVARLQTEQTARARLRQLRPYIHQYTPATPFATLLLLVGWLFFGTLVKCLLMLFTVILVQKLGHRAVFELRSQCYGHTLRLDLASFGDDRTSDLMSRLTNDLEKIGRGLSTLFGKLVREPLKVAVCLLGAAWICWRLLLLCLIVAPVAGILVSLLLNSIRRASRRAMEEMSQVYGVLSETFHGIVAVKAFTTESAESQRFRATSHKFYRKAVRISVLDAILKPSTEMMGISMVCLAMIAGGWLVLNQQTELLGVQMCKRPLGIGAIIAFYALLVGAADPVRKLSDVVSRIQVAAAAADRVYAVLDRPFAIDNPPQPRTAGRPHRELAIENVSFHYDPEEPVLQNVDLLIPHGETLAIVGPNGCGKSTLANLILRFYDPVSGALCLDGVDLREMNLQDLRSRIGLVAQQSILFDDTVMNNIRYGRADASEADILEAARRAHAHRFIEEKLERGYNTPVGEGGRRLSGGQRQRLALARAILRDPDLLILDEATSQIDPESEQLIHQALRDFVRGRTAIIITHRMSTLQLADRILVMEAGRVADIGSHDELARRCELYQRLQARPLKESA